MGAPNGSAVESRRAALKQDNDDGASQHCWPLLRMLKLCTMLAAHHCNLPHHFAHNNGRESQPLNCRHIKGWRPPQLCRILDTRQQHCNAIWLAEEPGCNEGGGARKSASGRRGAGNRRR